MSWGPEFRESLAYLVYSRFLCPVNFIQVSREEAPKPSLVSTALAFFLAIQVGRNSRIFENESASNYNVWLRIKFGLLLGFVVLKVSRVITFRSFQGGIAFCMGSFC